MLHLSEFVWTLRSSNTPFNGVSIEIKSDQVDDLSYSTNDKLSYYLVELIRKNIDSQKSEAELKEFKLVQLEIVFSVSRFEPALNWNRFWGVQ